MVYTFTESIGDIDYRPIIGIPFEKYNNYQTKNLLKENWGKKSTELDGENSLQGRRLIPKIFIPQVFDRIFGGNYIDLDGDGQVGKFADFFCRKSIWTGMDNRTAEQQVMRTADEVPTSIMQNHSQPWSISHTSATQTNQFTLSPPL